MRQLAVQPLCILEDPDTVVFFGWPGITPEFAFAAAGHLSDQGSRSYSATRERPGVPPRLSVFWNANRPSRGRLEAASAHPFPGGRVFRSRPG
jgi:hypothetical protein